MVPGPATAVLAPAMLVTLTIVQSDVQAISQTTGVLTTWKVPRMEVLVECDSANVSEGIESSGEGETWVNETQAPPALQAPGSH
jgi:hypothetical protein